MDLFDILRIKAGYEDVDVSCYEPDLQGWMQECFSYSFSNQGAPELIVEVGTWKGTSAIEMAKKSPGSKIICVDTWLGSPEHFDTIGKYGDVYMTFLKNVKRLGLQDRIVPLALPSLQAIEVLKKYRVKPDLLYIDAAHEYLPVKMDLEAYWEILKEGGTMMGDDYDVGWPGVIKAVDEFSKGKEASRVHVTWSIKK